MADPIAASPVTLPEFLRARALASAPRRLALDILLGAAVAAVAGWARPPGWVPLVSAGLAFALYGTWAVAERQLQPPLVPPAEPMAASRRAALDYLWFLLRALAAVGGLLAFALCLFALLGLSLGTWIS